MGMQKLICSRVIYNLLILKAFMEKSLTFITKLLHLPLIDENHNNKIKAKLELFYTNFNQA